MKNIKINQVHTIRVDNLNIIINIKQIMNVFNYKAKFLHDLI